MDADHDLTDDVTLSRRELDALLARIEDLEARVGATPRRTGAGSGRPDGQNADEFAGVSRRRALVGLAGAAAAGAVAAVAPASPAAAADGDPLVMGAVNDATRSTGLRVSGTDRGFGLGVADNAPEGDPIPAAVTGVAVGQAFDWAVGAQARDTASGLKVTSEQGHGVDIEAGTGRGIGVRSSSPAAAAHVHNLAEGHALLLAGRRQLEIVPNGRSGDPADDHLGGTAGELRWTGTGLGDGALWACITGDASGPTPPERWRKIVGPETAGALHLLATPVRVYDSRPGSLPATGPKAPLPGSYGPRPVSLATAVPVAATGALLTVQLVNATVGNGNLTVWASGRPRPQATTLLWGGDARRFSTQVTTAVGPDARVEVAASRPTDLVVEVVGYYR